MDEPLDLIRLSIDERIYVKCRGDRGESGIGKTAATSNFEQRMFIQVALTFRPFCRAQGKAPRIRPAFKHDSLRGRRDGDY